MMEDPQILVLDEPFNALDEASCENVKKMILSAKVPDRVVLLSCHDKNQINALCDETIKLYIKWAIHLFVKMQNSL